MIRLFKLLFFSCALLLIPMAHADKEIDIGGDFSLTDHNNKQFSLKQLRGKLVILFFGYTYCPDICPSELGTMARILKKLGNDSDKVSALFISVDPERDTPKKLKEYVPYFSKDLIGLTGSKDEIAEITKAYKVQTKIHSKKENSDYYLIDHSANLYVMNTQGKLIHLIPFGFPFEHILNILKEEITKL